MKTSGRVKESSSNGTVWKPVAVLFLAAAPLPHRIRSARPWNLIDLCPEEALPTRSGSDQATVGLAALSASEEQSIKLPSC